jgi:hypothetical protein
MRCTKHAGHVALVAAADHRRGAIADDAEEDGVRMVPGVAAGVVRRRRQAAGGERRAPVGLALKLRAVAGGAVRVVNRPPERDLPGRGRLRLPGAFKHGERAIAGDTEERERRRGSPGAGAAGHSPRSASQSRSKAISASWASMTSSAS